VRQERQLADQTAKIARLDLDFLLYYREIGVLPSEAPVGTYPDYFGASVPTAPGHFEDAVVTFNKNVRTIPLERRPAKRRPVARSSWEA